MCVCVCVCACVCVQTRGVDFGSAAQTDYSKISKQRGSPSDPHSSYGHGMYACVLGCVCVCYYNQHLLIIIKQTEYPNLFRIKVTCILIINNFKYLLYCH